MVEGLVNGVDDRTDEERELDGLDGELEDGLEEAGIDLEGLDKAVRAEVGTT